MKTAYLYLGAAILAEVIATSLLKTSQGFTRLWPSVTTVVGYAISFYCLAQTLGSVPTCVANAIWSGVGIVLISLIAWLVFGQTLDARAGRHGVDRRGRGGDQPVFDVGGALSAPPKAEAARSMKARTLGVR